MINTYVESFILHDIQQSSFCHILDKGKLDTCCNISLNNHLHSDDNVHVYSLMVETSDPSHHTVYQCKAFV